VEENNDRLYIGWNRKIRKKGHVFTLERVVRELKEKFPNVPEKDLRNAMYLEFFFLRSLTIDGRFMECQIPGIGIYSLRKIQKVARWLGRPIHEFLINKNPVKYGNLESLYEHDPFMREVFVNGKPSDNPKGLQRKKIENEFKKLDELGQRYYVLDR
jgi:hypothetical protein